MPRTAPPSTGPPPLPTHLALKTHGKLMKHLPEAETFYLSSPQLLASPLTPSSSCRLLLSCPPCPCLLDPTCVPPTPPRFAPGPSLHPSRLLPCLPPAPSCPWRLRCPPMSGLSQTQKHPGTDTLLSPALSPTPSALGLSLLTQPQALAVQGHTRPPTAHQRRSGKGRPERQLCFSASHRLPARAPQGRGTRRTLTKPDDPPRS